MALFYNSNCDKWEVPAGEGWFIGYKTESGDSSYLKVDFEPTSEADAEATLLCILDYEEDFTHIYWEYHTPPFKDIEDKLFGKK